MLQLTDAERRKWGGVQKRLIGAAAKKAPLLAHAGLLPPPPSIEALALRARAREAAYAEQMPALLAEEDAQRAAIWAEAAAISPECSDFVRGHRGHPYPPYYYRYRLGRWRQFPDQCQAEAELMRALWRGHLLRALLRGGR